MKIQRINRSKQRKQKSFSVVPQGWFAAKPSVNTSRGDNCERPLSPWLNISASSLVSGSVVAVLLFLLSGCAVGPNYRAPQTKAPAQWNESLAGGETNSSAASTEWWKNFHDSELDFIAQHRRQHAGFPGIGNFGHVHPGFLQDESDHHRDDRIGSGRSII